MCKGPTQSLRQANQQHFLLFLVPGTTILLIPPEYWVAHHELCSYSTSLRATTGVEAFSSGDFSIRPWNSQSVMTGILQYFGSTLTLCALSAPMQMEGG